MTATVKIKRLSGSGPTGTDITSGVATMSTSETEATATTLQTTHPIPVLAVTNYSYWVVTRLYADDDPVTVIQNIVWYTDGTNSFGTGVTCVGHSATGYVEPAGTEGTSGTALSKANYSTLRAEPSVVFNWTSGSPLVITGNISTGNAPAYFGDDMVYQLVVATNATQGTTGSETFTWQYDET